MFIGRRLPCLREAVIPPGRVIRERDTHGETALQLALLSDRPFSLTGDDSEAPDP
jgi:hypothetical protein